MATCGQSCKGNAHRRCILWCIVVTCLAIVTAQHCSGSYESAMKFALDSMECDAHLDEVDLTEQYRQAVTWRNTCPTPTAIKVRDYFLCMCPVMEDMTREEDRCMREDANFQRLSAEQQAIVWPEDRITMTDLWPVHAASICEGLVVECDGSQLLAFLWYSIRVEFEVSAYGFPCSIEADVEAAIATSIGNRDEAHEHFRVSGPCSDGTAPQLEGSWSMEITAVIEDIPSEEMARTVQANIQSNLKRQVEAAIPRSSVTNLVVHAPEETMRDFEDVTGVSLEDSSWWTTKTIVFVVMIGAGILIVIAFTRSKKARNKTSSQANAPTRAAQQANGNNYVVTCPQGASPGSVVHIQGVDGSVLAATVPAGISAGQAFAVPMAVPTAVPIAVPMAAVANDTPAAVNGVANLVSTSDGGDRITQAINGAGVSETSRVDRVVRLQTDAATATARTKGMAAEPDSCSQP